ncbi:MAG TPA: NAD(P)H-binding protein [Frankiaceae bacterium]|nr:NAD(P)H-binding protein [Frankiaceae bacterium]
MRIAVAGGTGLVGRHVVDVIRSAGHTPVVLARSTGVDVTTGSGLDAALDGSERLIDVTNVTAMSRRAALRFFEASTRHLLEASARAGIDHLVALSIVGVDRVDLGYYAGKRRQEELLLESAVPITVLRATQFHEFAEQMVQRAAIGPVVVLPRMLTQPVAAQEVAEELVRLALGEPLGTAPDFAGPEEHQMPDLVRQLLRSRGSRRRVIPLRLPGAAARAAASGGLLPLTVGPRGRQTFAEWLEAQPDPALQR